MNNKKIEEIIKDFREYCLNQPTSDDFMIVLVLNK